IQVVSAYPIPATPSSQQAGDHPTTLVLVPAASSTQSCYGAGCPPATPAGPAPVPTLGVKAQSSTGRQGPTPTAPIQFTGAAAGGFTVGKLTTILGALALAVSFAW